MKRLKFTIRGNPNDEHGNPMPKLKMTGNQYWTPQAQKYKAYKEQVLTSAKIHAKRGNIFNFPLDTEDQKMVMNITIHWKDEKHGDPENIFGAIADSLFTQDKHLIGSFDYTHSQDKRGKVEVEILIPDTHESA